MKIRNQYRDIMKKPIEKIQPDIFFHADNFRDEPWYGEFLLFTKIGICEAPKEYIMPLRKALKIAGYTTHAVEKDQKIYILPGDEPQVTRDETHDKNDRER